MPNANITSVSLSSQPKHEGASARLTEADLMNGFFKFLPKNPAYPGKAPRLLVPELDGLQGRPDLVDIHFRALPDAMSLDALAKSLRSPAQARLLALLRYRAPRRREYLEKFSGFTKQAFRGHLKELEKNGLVEFHTNANISLTCPLPWDMADIASYEGKLSNWRRAFHQALGYRSFSHRVWVIMPPTGARQATKLKTLFQDNGIGLMAYQGEGKTRVIVKGRKLRPASRILYLIAVGTGLTKFVEQQRFSHRRIRPESIQGT